MSDRPTLSGSPWDGLRAVGENVGDASEFIRDSFGDAKTALGRSVQSAARAMCASVSNGAEWIAELSPGGFQGTVDLCTPFWNDNGSGPPSLESPDPPFQGGQCAVEYLTQYAPSDNPTNWQSTNPSQLTGPISGAVVTNNGPGPSGTTNWGVVFTGANGSSTGQSANFAGPPGLVTRVVRVDGQPDNCGNIEPPPVIVPNPNPLPDPGYDPGEEPYPDPTGRPVIPLPPISDPFGRPIPLPDIKLPDFGDPSPFGPELGPGVPGPASDTGVGGDAEGSEPGKVLVGIQVALTLIPSYARIVETASENFYVGACYVYLGLPGRLDLQEEGRFVKNPQFFYAPMPSDSWRVVASPGYAIRVTPYYVQETQTV